MTIIAGFVEMSCLTPEKKTIVVNFVKVVNLVRINHCSHSKISRTIEKT
jgi:hypothetical protein